LGDPNKSKDDWDTENQSDIEMDNSSDDSETPEQGNVSPEPNDSGLIQPI